MITRARVLVLALAVVLSNVAGNLLLTHGLKTAAVYLGASPVGYLRVMANSWVVAGIVLLLCWTLARMTLLSWADLSFVLPVTSLGYVLSVAAAHLFLNEQVSGRRWIGTLLIVAGAATVGLSTHKTPPAEPQ